MKKFKKIISFLTFSILLLVILIGLNHLFKKEYSAIKYDDFYASPNEFDVLFYGSSLVQVGIYPTEIWEKTGVLSYNMGNYAEEIPMTYWVMKNSFDFHKPKIAVVDLGGINFQCDNKVNGENKHYFLDTLPLSKNKIGAINDIIEKKYKMEYIWSFSTYHTRWKELFNEEYDECKNGMGAAMHLMLTYFDGQYKDAEDAPLSISKMNKEYLEKIVQLCKENNVELLFTNLPTAGSRQAELRKWCEEYSIQNNIDYINFQDISVVDTRCDFTDVSHLNAKGAKEISLYIGNYLQKKYSLKSHKTEMAYLLWNEKYSAYQNRKIEALKRLQTLPEYIAFSYSEGYEINVLISSDSLVYYDENLLYLLEHVCPANELKKAQNNKKDYCLGNIDEFKEIPDGDIHFIIKKKETGEIVDIASFRANDSCVIFERVVE